MLEIHHGTILYSCNTLEIHRRWEMSRFAIRGLRKPDGGRASSSCWSVSHFHARKVFSTSAAPAKHSHHEINKHGCKRNEEILEEGQ